MFNILCISKKTILIADRFYLGKYVRLFRTFSMNVLPDIYFIEKYNNMEFWFWQVK
jgi:hypothetical protein